MVAKMAARSRPGPNDRIVTSDSLNRYCALGAGLNQYCSAKSGRLLFDSIAHGRRVPIAEKLAAQAQSVCWRTTLSRSSQPILIEEAHFVEFAGSDHWR